MHSPISHSAPDLTATDISEEDIRQLVHAFYAQVRQDPLLGPIFNTHVAEWDSHLQMLVDFWSWLVLKKPGFEGTPMPKHMRLPSLTWAHFERWLELFHATTNALKKPQLKVIVDAMSGRIAATLWENYCKHNPGEQWLREMPPGLACYKQSPVFTSDTLPQALKAQHSTKAGAWGLLRVLSGALVFTLDEQVPQTILLRAGEQLVIEPQRLHHVTFVEPGSMQIDFHRVNED